MNTVKQKKSRRGGDWLKPYQFKPGQSGNPKGRKKGSSITDEIAKALERKVPRDAEGRTWKRLLAESIIKHAVHGHGAAMGYVLDRIEGKVKEHIDHEITNKISVDVIKEIRRDAGLNIPSTWNS